MHGRRRDEYKARLEDPKIAAGMAQKAQQWNTLSRELLQRRRRPAVISNDWSVNATQDEARRHAETLALTEKLLRVNPDPLTLWNHRRDLLLLGTIDEKPFDTAAELVLTASCLERNPKAYGAWFHRKWSIQQSLARMETRVIEVLEHELSLCNQFLQLDERNFHCWNYRRFVVSALMQLCRDEADNSTSGTTVDGSWMWSDDAKGSIIVMGAQIKPLPATIASTPVAPNAKLLGLLQSEWDFTTEKIRQNFSNCSAFHYRSKLLPLRLTEDDSLSRMSLARSELRDMVHNAIFTEPDDQTAWWYHRFLLLDWLSPCVQSNEYRELLMEEQELLTELIETEDKKCKWGWLALHMVLTQMADQQEQEPRTNDCLQHLIELDPDRAARYESMKV